jgi:choline dehydrogenase-like flavoprotein
VVVGSGAGGAPVAAELAEAGFDVAVVEEGSYYQTRDFTANTSQMVRQLYRDGGATIAIGNPPIMFQEGRAVGGSTVINGGMSWRTPDDILARWRDEAGLADLTTAALEPYYERVEKRIHVAPADPDAIGKDMAQAEAAGVEDTASFVAQRARGGPSCRADSRPFCRAAVDAGGGTSAGL